MVRERWELRWGSCRYLAKHPALRRAAARSTTVFKSVAKQGPQHSDLHRCVNHWEHPGRWPTHGPQLSCWARNRFGPTQLGWECCLGAEALSPALMVRSRPRTSAVVRRRCHAVRHLPGADPIPAISARQLSSPGFRITHPVSQINSGSPGQRGWGWVTRGCRRLALVGLGRPRDSPEGRDLSRHLYRRPERARFLNRPHHA